MVLTSTFYVTLTFLPDAAMGATLYVGGVGPGNYTTIQSAVNDANPGDTVFVYGGTYAEDVSIFKSLTLLGEDRHSTVIRGTGTADTLLVTTDNVTISGFTVENSGSVDDEAGIRLFFVQDCHLTNNILSGNSIGITLRRSDYNSIDGNAFSDNENGIYLWQSYFNRIENNSISNNSVGLRLVETNNNTALDNALSANGFGIRITDSSHLTFAGNAMAKNGIFLTGSFLEQWNTHLIDTSNTVNGKPVRYWKNATGGTIPTNTGEVILANCQGTVVDNQNASDGSVGIIIGYSSYLTITNNTALSNSFDGIYLYRSENNTIFDNTVSNNGNDGISLHVSHMNDMANNIASRNTRNGISLYSSVQNSIIGNDLSRNGGYGFSLEYSDYNFVTDNDATSNTDIGGYLYYSDVNRVDSNNLSNTGFGLSLSGANSNSVENNTAIDTTRGFSLFSSAHNVISDNIAVSNWEGFHLSLSIDNTLVNNYASSHNTTYTMGSITLWFSASNTLVGNVMVGNGLVVAGDFLEQWNTHKVDTSNTVNGRSVEYWSNVTGGTVPQDAGEVILANCTNVIVENQNLSGGSFGIEIGFSKDNLLANNTVMGSGVGLYVHISNGNTLFGNRITGSQDGLVLAYSDFNAVDGNTASSNSRKGIGVYFSDNNTITSNDVWTNDHGVYLTDSDGNTVLNNNAISNDDGIYLSSSYDNVLHGNNIIDNARQGYDNRDSSQWDNGYPIGGNFWSDYTGVDVMNGPNQDMPGSDGIGDTPYVIDADSEDRYPLMSPLIPLPPSAPLNLLASTGNQEISLAWDAPSFDGGLPIVNYRIYRGTTPGGEVFHVEIGNVLTHIDTGLVNGQMYCYRVSAVNPVGEGAMSNEACATPTTAPGSPVVVRAELTGTGFENVKVEWNLSRDDGGGQDSVVGYLVFRGTIYDVNGAGYQLAATVPDGTTYFDDNMAGEGEPSNYFYQICAVDLNNLTNCSQNQAGKFTQHLLSGVNLVSIPLIQSEENIETTLQTVKWDKAWTYDSSVQRWKSHILFKPYRGELEEVNHSIGFWVNVSENSNLTLAGLVPSSTAVYLCTGWNLVGFPSFNHSYTVADLKAVVAVNVVEGFDGLTTPFFLKEMTDGDFLQAGFGYWIEVDSESGWIVENT